MTMTLQQAQQMVQQQAAPTPTPPPGGGGLPWNDPNNDPTPSPDAPPVDPNTQIPQSTDAPSADVAGVPPGFEALPPFPGQDADTTYYFNSATGAGGYIKSSTPNAYGQTHPQWVGLTIGQMKNFRQMVANLPIKLPLGTDTNAGDPNALQDMLTSSSPLPAPNGGSAPGGGGGGAGGGITAYQQQQLAAQQAAAAQAAQQYQETLAYNNRGQDQSIVQNAQQGRLSIAQAMAQIAADKQKEQSDPFKFGNYLQNLAGLPAGSGNPLQSLIGNGVSIAPDTSSFDNVQKLLESILQGYASIPNLTDAERARTALTDPATHDQALAFFNQLTDQQQGPGQANGTAIGQPDLPAYGFGSASGARDFASQIQGASPEQLAALQAMAQNAPHMATGGSAYTSGPAVVVDLATGQPKALIGEAGPERMEVIPQGKPGYGSGPDSGITRMAGGGNVDVGAQWRAAYAAYHPQDTGAQWRAAYDAYHPGSGGPPGTWSPNQDPRYGNSTGTDGRAPQGQSLYYRDANGNLQAVANPNLTQQQVDALGGKSGYLDPTTHTYVPIDDNQKASLDNELVQADIAYRTSHMQGATNPHNVGQPGNFDANAFWGNYNKYGSNMLNWPKSTANPEQLSSHVVQTDGSGGGGGGGGGTTAPDGGATPSVASGYGGGGYNPAPSVASGIGAAPNPVAGTTVGAPAPSIAHMANPLAAAAAAVALPPRKRYGDTLPMMAGGGDVSTDIAGAPTPPQSPGALPQTAPVPAAPAQPQMSLQQLAGILAPTTQGVQTDLAGAAQSASASPQTGSAPAATAGASPAAAPSLAKMAASTSGTQTGADMNGWKPPTNAISVKYTRAQYIWMMGAADAAAGKPVTPDVYGHNWDVDKYLVQASQNDAQNTPTNTITPAAGQAIALGKALRPLGIANPDMLSYLDAGKLPPPGTVTQAFLARLPPTLLTLFQATVQAFGTTIPDYSAAQHRFDVPGLTLSPTY